jgi:hypothetical protein
MQTTITSGAITAVNDLGHPLVAGVGWTESHAIGVRTDNTSANEAFFVQTFTAPAGPAAGVWHTMDVTDLGIPADVQNIFLSGFLIITHGSTAETCNLTVAMRAKGDDLLPGNYICQTIESSVSGGQRTNCSTWVPVRQGQWEIQWNRAPVTGDYPTHCAFGINFHAQAYVRYAPVDSVGTVLGDPIPNNGAIFVAPTATGGAGTVGSPWTGWDTALTWNQGEVCYDFGAGHYALTAPIQITTSHTCIRGAGKGLTVLHYSPTTDSATGVFDFSAGGGINSQSSLTGLSIRSSDSTFQKVGVHLTDVSQFTLQDVAIGTDGGWTGNLSQGVVVNGAAKSALLRSELNGDLPVWIKKSPTQTADLDDMAFHDLTLMSTNATGLYGANRLPVVLIDSGLTLQSVTFDGYQDWWKGSDGLRWVDTTSATTSTNLSLSNVQWRGGTYAGGYLVYVEHNQALQNLLLSNIAGGANANGIRLKKVRGATIDNYTYPGTLEALNADNSVYSLLLRNAYIGSGTLVLDSLVLIAASGAADANRIGWRLYDAAPVTSVWTTLSSTSLTSARQFSSGTALSTANFTLSSGWGSTASLGSVGAFDARGSFTITSAGTGQTASPTVQLTFGDGAWPGTPVCNAFRLGGDQLSLVPAMTTGSPTTATFTFPGTPVAGQTFTVGYRCTR